jgi:hypothetical protein
MLTLNNSNGKKIAKHCQVSEKKNRRYGMVYQKDELLIGGGPGGGIGGGNGGSSGGSPSGSI